MRVLQIIPRLDSGGAERTTFEIASAILADGGEAYVLTEGGKMVESLSNLGAQVDFLPVKSKNPFILRNNAQKIAGFIRKFEIDVLHARSRAPAWSSYWAGKATRTPFLTTYHGCYRAENPLKRFYNSIMVRGDHVIANSHFIRSLILEEYRSFSFFKTLSEKISVIPRGVETRVFSPDLVSKKACKALRRTWLKEQDRGQSLWLLPGRLTEWKGQEIALRAFAHILQNKASGTEISTQGQGNPDRFDTKTGDLPAQKSDTAPFPHLVLLGDDQGRKRFRQKLEALIQEMNLSGHVSFQPHISDIITAYAISDLVLSPATRPEAFGRVAIEAQAMGKPVIVADHGGARETVIQGETGWRVKPGSIMDLAHAMEKLEKLEPSTRDALELRARAHVANNFSLVSMQRKTLEVYREVLQNYIP